MDSKYEKLPEEIKDLVPRKQLSESIKYSKSDLKLQLLFMVMDRIFNIVFIVIDLPAIVWYGWLEVLENDGHCGAGDTYDIWM